MRYIISGAEHVVLDIQEQDQNPLAIQAYCKGVAVLIQKNKRKVNVDGKQSITGRLKQS